MLYTPEELKEKMRRLPYYTLKNYLGWWTASLGSMKDQALKEELKIYIKAIEELLQE
jgi:hypothetical protein